MKQYFIGVDFHKSTSYLHIQDQYGQLVKSGRIENRQENLQSFLAPYPNAAAVLEAGRNWTLMYDWLENLGAKVTLAHPLKVKAIASAKIKTDKIDASVLAHLLRADLIPMAYVPTQDARTAREILRQRMFLVRMSTMVKNRVLTILARHPELPPSPGKLIFSQKNRPWLETLPIPAHELTALNQDLTLLDNLKARIEESNQAIEKLFQENPKAQLLETIPGIGIFFATLIAHEVDDITRFPSPKKLAAYVGLVPSTYSSGNRTTHGRITKQGNKWLRWCFVEAVWPAVRKDPEIRRFYEKIKSRKGANPAKVATARRLLSIAYRMLKDNRPYEVRQLS
jgi:transposase